MTEAKGPLKIVFLQRGNIVVGNVSMEGDLLVISNAYVIRRWGTTHGIGEIALGGPTAFTKLDKLGETMAHILTVVQIIRCDASKWIEGVVADAAARR